MTKDEITFIRGLSKPLRNASYDEISTKVNEEIEKLGEGATFAKLRVIEKKLGLPRGTAFEMSGFADYFEADDSNKEWITKP